MISINKGLYLSAKIIQHVIEPSLIQAISNGKEIVDLTGSLLKQGISHWKHSNRTIQFHAPPKAMKVIRIPFFPSGLTYSYARVGCQIISCDSFVSLTNGSIMRVQRIYCRNDDLIFDGELFESGQMHSANVKEVRQRFDPCFDIAQLFRINGQSDWNGDPVIPTETRVNFK